jgi:ABC-type phosphate transport system ATPase subunit
MKAGLIVKNLTKSIEGKKILDNISFSVNPGQVFALVGGSGTGKTTLLKTINRLIDADSGDIVLNNHSIKNIDPIELRRKVGMILQTPIMFDGSVLDNVSYGLKIRGENGNSKLRIIGAIKDSGLPKKFLKRNANKISGGEQQRVALARLLVLEPMVLLLDEPTAALDPKLTRKIEGTILKLCKSRNLIILWVTHNHSQARRVGEYIGLLKNGKIKIIKNVKTNGKVKLNKTIKNLGGD